MLEKVVVVDKIEILQNGCVQVREATRVLEDGELLSEKYERHVVAPGEDYSNEDPKVQSICGIIHTPEVVAAYHDLLSSRP